MNEIFCLFSIENDHDQPDNNLIAWFKSKPTIEDLIERFNVDLSDNEKIINIVKLWNGELVRLLPNTYYRLRKVKEL